jgi:hypothetical protein
MEKLATHKKFRVSAAMSAHAKEWDDSGVAKVKVRVPTLEGRREFLLEPGKVVKTNDPRAAIAFEGLRLSQKVKVGGSAALSDTAVFETAASNATVHRDLADVEVR